PAGQEGSHDNTETVHSFWVRPEEALRRHDRDEIELAFATRTILTLLARPAIAQGRDGPKIFRLGDAPYYEIHWSDPAETTQTTYDLVPGVPKRLDAY